MKRSIAFLLAALMLTLAACGGSEETTTQASTAAPTTQFTQAPTQPATEATTVPETEPPTEPTPTEPEGIANPLNGQVSDTAWYTRPYAVVFNNVKAAQPLCGAGEADVMIEALVEGGITRFLAIYSDPASAEHVGSVSSARPVFVELARAFQAIFVHAGGSQQAYDLISELGYPNLDGYRNGRSVFYRDGDRQEAGYSREHAMFTEGSDIAALAAQEGYVTTLAEPLDYGYQYSIYGVIGEGSPAQSISVRFRKNGKLTAFAYDAELEAYRAGQYGQEMADENTGGPIAFSNVLVLEVETTAAEEIVQMELTGHGYGWFASGGTMIPIRWSRESKTEPFAYTALDGTPITFRTGRTYIGLVPTGSPVTFE